jgi:hypothetical protein
VTTDQIVDEVSGGLSKLAGSYKAVVILIGLQLCVTVVPILLVLVGGESLMSIAVALRMLRPIVLLLTVLFLPVYTYRVFDALGSKLKVIWAILAIVPILNIIVLGWMSRQASVRCRELGVPIGLFGPKRKTAQLTDR